MKGIIIEDDPKIVEFIAIALQIGWPEFKLEHAGTGEKGLDLIKKETSEVVLLDLGLPDISGFDLLRKIRLFSNVPIIIITASNEEADVIKGLQLGADDYVAKPFRQLELMARIQTVIRRQKQNLKEALTKDLLLGEWNIDPVKHILYDCKNSAEVRLTVTEMSLLMHLIRNAGQVVTLKSIANEIWGTDYQGSNHAIRVYIQRLRGKIEYQGPPHSRVYRQLIFTQPSVGYYIKKL